MNIILSLHIILALIWTAVSGQFSLPNFVLGLIISGVGLWLIREHIGELGHIRRVRSVIGLAALFFKELFISGVKVSLMAIHPKIQIQPAIFSYPLRTRSPFEIALLANLITLTPGTLSIDVSDDRRTLFIHTVTGGEIEAMRADIASGFERRIIEAFQ